MVQEKLRSTRKKLGVTQESLGKKIGKSKQYMSELERGNIKLSYKMAVQIAKALEAKPEDIFLPR